MLYFGRSVLMALVSAAIAAFRLLHIRTVIDAILGNHIA
jgi:hypothetical protein